MKHEHVLSGLAERRARLAGEVGVLTAIFLGPEARERAEAYAQWLNAGAALRRRRTDPGFTGRTAPER